MEKFTVELTKRECATVFAIMDVNAKESAKMAAQLRRILTEQDVGEELPLVTGLAQSYATDAAVMITVREKMRNACPELADAETEA